MREVARAGIEVWGFFGPILPTFSDGDRELAEMFEAMAQSGASRVLVDTMNLYPKVRSTVRKVIGSEFPEHSDAFEEVLADPGAYAAELSERVEAAAQAVGIEADVCF
jgi:DNA repair photolyase